MKKRGFTLAELLIVLGIAGVVAAVILPAINGLMPDKTKINYLKVYDELGKNIKALTSDSSIFPVLLKEGSTDIDVSRYPLVNNSQPLKAPFNDDTKYSGDNKLCNLLAHTFGADSCSTTSYPDNSSFTTPNGMEWWISQTKREIDTAENKISYQTDIYVDVDASKKSSNCMYGEDGCKNPDRFKFLLAADGRLVPADPVGVHYINTRKNLLKKKFDVEGEVLASLDDIDFSKLPSSGGEGTVQTPDTTPPDNTTGTNTGDSEENLPAEEAQDCTTDFALCRCGSVYRGRIINCYTRSTHSNTFTYPPSDNDRWSYYLRNQSLIFHKIGEYTIIYYQPSDITFQFPLKKNFYAPRLEKNSNYIYSLVPFLSDGDENIEDESGKALVNKISDWGNKRFGTPHITPGYYLGTYMPVYYVLPAGRTEYKAPDILPEFIQNLTVEDLQSLEKSVKESLKDLRVYGFSGMDLQNYDLDFYPSDTLTINVDNDYIYLDTNSANYFTRFNSWASLKSSIDSMIEQSEKERYAFEKEKLNMINQFIQDNKDKYIEYK